MATKITTRYGLQYSPHYARESRARRTQGPGGGAEPADQ